MKPAPDALRRYQAVYAALLHLYPQSFRKRHAQAMQQAFKDALTDHAIPRRTLVPLLLYDLAASLAKEHLSMLRDTFSRPALVLNALVLSILSSGLALALYAIPQHLLRSGADDPQIAMAGDLAAKLEQGVSPEQAVAPQSIDMATSLSPFVIVYDDQGHPLASQALLGGSVPVLPQGVFNYVRQHGQERLSWQPVLGREHGVRIAAIVQRVEPTNGAAGGFVLAGRNLREVEARIGQVSQMAGLTWLGMLAVILAGSAAFALKTRRTNA